MGFNLPAYNHLSINNNDRSQYILTIPFVPNIKDVAFDEAVVRVILPEGSSDITFDAPFPVDSQGSDTIFTYLDTVGRPVLVLNKKNLSPEHSTPIKIIYRYSSMSLLREPFLLIVAFFSIFVGFIVYLRCDFTIGQSSKKTAPNTADIDAAVKVVKPIYDERQPLVEAFAKTVDALKATGEKASGPFEAHRAKVDQMLKKTTAKVDEAISKLRGVEPKFADLLSQLFAKQRDLVVTYGALGDLNIKKIRKDVNPQDFKSRSESLIASLEELKASVEDLEGQVF